MSALSSEGPRSDQTSEWRVSDAPLFEAIEWHLLKAQLTPAQARCVERDGWFDVVWRAQWLVLRIYTDRFPTVDAYQLERDATYLCSFDVRKVVQSREPRLRFPTASHTPVGLARRVLEAHRRGALKALLEASETVRAQR